MKNTLEALSFGIITVLISSMTVLGFLGVDPGTLHQNVQQSITSKGLINE